MKINGNYLNLEESYLFSAISRRVNDYKNNHVDADIIRLGIGDVTLPLTSAVVDAMTDAVGKMGNKKTFCGYGQEQGYEFLRSAICNYYSCKSVNINIDEVFISDGAKSDLGNILDIFSNDNNVLIPSPVYPVYVDTNIMAGRNITYINADKDNNFLPMPDEKIKADIIYLCSPNNPTGAVYNKEQLKSWVDYAIDNNAIILFDSAYEAFIEDDFLPTSIYQIEGAEKCAVEFCSFSKTAGFTGTRCGYTIVPNSLEYDNVKINKLWLRRQSTKFNGVSYIVQRGAAAAFGKQGITEFKENINYYKRNAEIITKALDEKNIFYTGGKNSPYIWFECTGNMDSWQFFQYLLENAQVVGTPGEGFGKNSKSFFRLTAFGDYEKTKTAIERLNKIL